MQLRSHPYSPSLFVMTRRAFALRARAGFSMIEMLIVLLIGGIMAQLSLGKVHDLMSHQRVMHAATAIQNDLEAAFQIAGRDRKPVNIVWTPSAQQFSITDRTGAVIYRKTTLGKQAYGFDENAVTVSALKVQVFPNGLADTDLLITLSSNGMKKKLHMSRAGLVKAE